MGKTIPAPLHGGLTLKPTTHGRCVSCHYAMAPALGPRGPYVKCPTNGFRCVAAELKAENWSKQPQVWQRLWPVPWASVPYWNRPIRPVKNALSKLHSRPRRRYLPQDPRPFKQQVLSDTMFQRSAVAQPNKQELPQAPNTQAQIADETLQLLCDSETSECAQELHAEDLRKHRSQCSPIQITVDSDNDAEMACV